MRLINMSYFKNKISATHLFLSMKTWMLFFLFITTSVVFYGQEKKIAVLKGIVKNDANDILVGATVFIQGTRTFYTKNKDGKFAVVSIMAQEDKKSNETFEFLDKYLPKKVNDTVKVNNDFNINKVLPQNRSYYTYTGSLTTPPCTESVQWFIFKTPIVVSIKMITDLKKIMPLNNFRNVQELNGRKIKESI